MGRPIDPDLPVGVWAPMSKEESEPWLLCLCGEECQRYISVEGTAVQYRDQAEDFPTADQFEYLDDSDWHCPVCNTEVNEPAGERPYRRS